MRKPDIPNDEENRLKALYSTDLLDSLPEERFDRITRLTKKLFHTKIALITLVDRDRQWFKSRFGLDVEETPREVSFCGHAIHKDDVMVIEDTLKDERFSDNPLVEGEPQIRFYAGYPLRHPEGHKLGTLCIIDDKPREFSKEDEELLRDMGDVATRELTATQTATMDELTNVSNRRGFKALSQNSLNFCQREQFDAALCFIDLNEFKPINDKFGHAEGDKALKEFAQTLEATFRGTDIVARFGGDEFVVLMSDTNRDKATEFMGRFQSNIETVNQNNPKGYRLKYSWGLVDIPHDSDHDIDAILKQADALMYQNKKRKR